MYKWDDFGAAAAGLRLDAEGEVSLEGFGSTVSSAEYPPESGAWFSKKFPACKNKSADFLTSKTHQ